MLRKKGFSKNVIAVCIHTQFKKHKEHLEKELHAFLDMHVNNYHDAATSSGSGSGGGGDATGGCGEGKAERGGEGAAAVGGGVGGAELAAVRGRGLRLQR